MSSQTRIKPGYSGSIQKALNRPPIIDSSCATSSPAGPASSARTLQIKSQLAPSGARTAVHGNATSKQHHGVVIIGNLAVGGRFHENNTHSNTSRRNMIRLPRTMCFLICAGAK